jgi:phosphopantetheine adenylyltransferase
MASDDLKKEIDDVRKEMDELEEKLNEKKAVLRYLENKANKPIVTVKPGAPSAIGGGVIQLDQLIIPESERRTLSDDIGDIIKRFGSQEFTVAHIDVVMQQQGIKDKAGEFIPRSRISTALGKLEDDGLIVRTFKGAGNVPHRFKVKGAMNDQL